MDVKTVPKAIGSHACHAVSCGMAHLSGRSMSVFNFWLCSIAQHESQGSPGGRRCYLGPGLGRTKCIAGISISRAVFNTRDFCVVRRTTLLPLPMIERDTLVIQNTQLSTHIIEPFPPQLS